jgi:hypothetical protein
MVFVDCGDVELARKIRENSQTLVMHDRQVRVDFSKSRAQRDKDRTSAPPPSHQYVCQRVFCVAPLFHLGVVCITVAGRHPVPVTEAT